MDNLKTSAYRTKSFTLTTSYTPDQPLLAIKLQDLNDGAIYERTYSEDDYSNQINRKVDLEDIFNAFFQGGDDAKLQQNHLQEYTYGSDICHKESGTSFIVKSGGLVVVNLDVMVGTQMRRLASELQLNKVGDISEK